jgi:Trk-type K+ transport system membrane component
MNTEPIGLGVPVSETRSSTPVFYSILRKVFFVVVISLFLLAILYLIYHNGKSIYDNGI